MDRFEQLHMLLNSVARMPGIDIKPIIKELAREAGIHPDSIYPPKVGA